MVVETIITLLFMCIAAIGAYYLGYIEGRTDKDYEEWKKKN